MTVLLGRQVDGQEGARSAMTINKQNEGKARVCPEGRSVEL